MSPSPLSETEREIWLAWKQAADAVAGRVERELVEETGLSEAEFGLLSRLVDLGGGALRQQELADSLSWDKSRLSHQLNRMQERKLVQRKRNDHGAVMVAITAAGKQALHSARPVFAAAVRRHLLDKLPRPERARLVDLLGRLGAD